MDNSIKSELSPSYRDRFPKKEGERHRQAFFFYDSLGPARTYKKVAVQFKCSIEAVKVWSRAFRWRERIGQREREERDQLIVDKRAEILDVRKGLITLGKLLIEDALKRAAPIEESLREMIDKGVIRIRSPKDAKDVKDFVLGAVEWVRDSEASLEKDTKSDAQHVQVNLVIEK